jgi:hypothetical protein
MAKSLCSNSMAGAILQRLGAIVANGDRAAIDSAAAAKLVAQSRRIAFEPRFRAERNPHQ